MLELVKNETWNIYGSFDESRAAHVPDSAVNDNVRIEQLASIHGKLHAVRTHRNLTRANESELILHAEHGADSQVHAGNEQKDIDGHAKHRRAKYKEQRGQGRKDAKEGAQADAHFIACGHPLDGVSGIDE